MTRPLPHDHPAQGAGYPRSDYFVEWQITDGPGMFIDLADVPEIEVPRAHQAGVGTISGH